MNIQQPKELNPVQRGIMFLLVINECKLVYSRDCLQIDKYPVDLHQVPVVVFFFFFLLTALEHNRNKTEGR